jgi:hypothetical protein
MSVENAGQLAPALGQEHSPPGEEAILLRIEQIVRRRFEQDYPPGTPKALRDAHPKSHGCVKAEFTVHANLPEELQIGVFKEPRTYPAWVRYSASASALKPDTVRDAHGMSIKLLGVEGDKILEEEKQETTHDFVLANNQVYFVRNAPDYAVFSDALANNRALSYFFGWNPFNWHLYVLKHLLTATKKLVSNPLEIQYWSQTPYRLGPHAVKYSARPRSLPLQPQTKPSGDDALRQAMVRQLETGEAIFDFLVQRQVDPVRMPVEDATIVWNDQLSDFQKVATIRIPAQNFNTEARDNFAENLSYTPWHALPDHRPLGGINRARRRVYETISRLRHEINKAPRREPTGQEEV